MRCFSDAEDEGKTSIVPNGWQQDCKLEETHNGRVPRAVLVVLIELILGIPDVCDIIQGLSRAIQVDDLDRLWLDHAFGEELRVLRVFNSVPPKYWWRYVSGWRPWIDVRDMAKHLHLLGDSEPGGRLCRHFLLFPWVLSYSLYLRPIGIPILMKCSCLFCKFILVVLIQKVRHLVTEIRVCE